MKPHAANLAARFGARLGVWLPVLVGVLSAWLARADSITLRPVVRLDAETTSITLGDIAQLDGPVARSLAATPITTLEKSAGAWTSVDVARVREALKGRTDLNWSALTIHGQSTQLRRMEAPKPVEEAKPAPEPEVAENGPNLRLAITRRLTDMLAVGPEQLRLKFDDRDEKILTTGTTGRIVDIQPLGGGDRIPLTVHVYEGEKLIVNSTLRVQAEVQRHVAIATGTLKRGQILADADMTTEDRWLPATARPLPADQAVGKAIRQRVVPGDVINLDDVQPPVIVKRGELVSVHCINNGFVLKLTCRALSDGRDGEAISFETMEPDRKARRTIVARLSGPGTAIAASTGADPPPTPAKSAKPTARLSARQ